jgi:hypothetical protein
MATYNAGENRKFERRSGSGDEELFLSRLPLQTERFVYKIAVARSSLSSRKMDSVWRKRLL